MSAADDAYLNTRVAVMASRLFSTERIESLGKKTLPELAEEFRLESILDDSLSVRAKSRAVEQTLIHVLLSDLTILIRPMGSMERDLLLKWGRKFALFNLKTLLRGKLYDRDQGEIRENLYDLPAAVRLPIPHRELFRAESVQELLRLLEQGRYGLIARQAREVYEQKREPFALEAAIDQRYYGELARAVMQFRSDSLQPLRQLLGAVLDQVDLLWMLRFRFSYRLSPSETFYHLVPSFRLLHRDRLLELVNLDSFEQLLAELPPPLDEIMAGCTNLIDVQKRAGSYMSREIRRTLTQSSSGVARALAYLLLRERDLFALFSLIQGRLLQLPEDLIQVGVELAEPECPFGMGAAA